MQEWLGRTQEGAKDTLWVPLDEAKEMFDNPINRIIAAVHGSLRRIGGKCDFMLIVGGFGESPYLFKRLQAEFQHVTRQAILSPDVPSQAVLKGSIDGSNSLMLPTLTCLCWNLGGWG